MSLDTYPCPKCRSLLRRTSQTPPGSAVRCASCANVLTVPPEPQIATAPLLLDEEVAPRRRGNPRRPPKGPRRVRLDNDFRPDTTRWFRMAGEAWADFLWPYNGFTSACGAVLGFFTVAAIFSVALTFGLSLLVIVPLMMVIGQITAALPLRIGIWAVTHRDYELIDFIYGLSHLGPILLYAGLNFAFALVMYGPLAALLVYLHWDRSMPTVTEVLAVGSYALLLVPTVYFFLQTRFSFALQLVFDQDMGLFKAMATSWKMTRGHFLSLFSFQIVQWLILLAGALPCGIAWPFVLPYVILLRAASYVDATTPREDQIGYLPGDEDDQY